MFGLPTPAVETATGATAEVFAQIKKAAGKVPNTFAAIGAHGPAALKAILNADAVLAAGLLSKQEQEVIKLAVSAAVGCDYCEAAHAMLSKLAGLKADAIRQIRAGQTTGDARHDALARFVRLLVLTRGTIRDKEYAAVTGAGYPDAPLVALNTALAVITFTNVFNRINDTTLDFPPAP